MVNESISSVLSIESEVARPRVLATGSLAACLAELQEALLHDVPVCHRAALRIVAAHPQARAVEILTVRVSGDNA